MFIHFSLLNGWHPLVLSCLVLDHESIVDALEHADFHLAVALATKDSKEHGASQRMKARSTATSNKSTKKKASNGLMAMFAKNAADKRKRKNY